MCPQLKDVICRIVDIGPEHVECVTEDHCLGEYWPDCSVYVSQFFFDKNDEFVGQLGAIS